MFEQNVYFSLILITIINISNSLLTCGPPNVLATLPLCTIDGVPSETIYINQRVNQGIINCNAVSGSQCADTTIVALPNRFTINCNSPNACQRTRILTGVPLAIPVPSIPIVTLPNKNIIRVSGSVNCDDKLACSSSKIIFSGNYPGGIVLSALGLQALQNSEIICDLAKGQQCRLICSTEVDSCRQARVTCNSCNCICTGKFCPRTIVQGRDCPRETPKNKKYPEIECTPDIPPPDECLDAPFIKESDINGELKCIETADCCSCVSINCGPECKSVLCDGERSCIGVPININGLKGGASLTCNLPRSCALADINGINVNMINCNGEESCQRALFNINRVYEPGLGGLLMACGGTRSCQYSNLILDNVARLSCGGDDSCDHSKIDAKGVTNGMVLDCSGNSACDNSIITLTNVFSWFCTGNFGCRNTQLTFDCVLPKGCALQCTGTQSCRESLFIINNINAINCGGSGAGCFLSNLKFKCINDGCPINCNNQDACRRSIINVDKANGLTCQGSFACAASQITVTNNINSGLTCSGQSACRDTIINKMDNLNKIECFSFRACRDSNIATTCNNIDGCNYICNGVESCLNATMSATNVITADCIEDRACQSINTRITPFDNLFRINCLTPLTCQSGIFNVMITKPTITKIEGLSCLSTESCLEAKFTFDGRILTTQPLSINRIFCEGIRSCVGAVFRFINAQINSQNFICEDGACDIVKNIICQSFNGTTLPIQSCIIDTPIIS